MISFKSGYNIKIDIIIIIIIMKTTLKTIEQLKTNKKHILYWKQHNKLKYAGLECVSYGLNFSFYKSCQTVL